MLIVEDFIPSENLIMKSLNLNECLKEESLSLNKCLKVSILLPQT